MRQQGGDLDWGRIRPAEMLDRWRNKDGARPTSTVAPHTVTHSSSALERWYWIFEASRLVIGYLAALTQRLHIYGV